MCDDDRKRGEQKKVEVMVNGEQQGNPIGRLQDRALSVGWPKPRGQPSLIATTIYADTPPTWTTYEVRSPH